MNIQNIPLADIHPYARNPRKNDEAVKNVAASIREFGFLVPLVIDAGHEIVAGHTRYKAAQSLGMKEVPCVIADELTEDQIKAFRLADNKVGEMAAWDMDLLPLELAGIMLPMTDFGFETISDEDFSENFTLDDGEKKPFQQISITVHDEQAKLILAAIKYVYDQKAVNAVPPLFLFSILFANAQAFKITPVLLHGLIVRSQQSSLLIIGVCHLPLP